MHKALISQDAGKKFNNAYKKISGTGGANIKVDEKMFKKLYFALEGNPSNTKYIISIYSSGAPPALIQNDLTYIL